ncbi:hypothetical protein BJ878DRAFT_313848 [Calycina marina]|uniref:LDB19 N-terminal domain-containing protein n=1 Tax=Calycina marina TaxID=1763456 RepID=A0A9P7Z732_9HELO|nr:hypothetical protein BJ878DRAFT_313848 [Calycina marina]
MPHRVATFLRHHAHSFDLPTDVKKGPRKLSNSKASRPSFSDRSLSSSDTSVSSKEEMAHLPGSIKRLSLGKSTPKHSSKSIPQIQTSLDIGIESPPLVLYGTTVNSTGALLSGQLKVVITEDHVTVDELKMRMVQDIHIKKAFHNHCKDCERKSTELNQWNFSQGTMILKRGEQSIPFSFLLPGSLPASMNGMLSEIQYSLKATLKTTSGEIIKTSHALDIKRAVHPGDRDRRSIRIFPPTNIIANCELPSVIHPIGETNLKMKIDGVVKRDNKTQTQWRLKRLTWRLDETQKLRAPACTKHAAKLGKDADEAKKFMVHEEVRTIGSAELREGWKADYESVDSSIEFEFPFGVKAGEKPICNMHMEDGTEITHTLVVEMIVTEEFAPLGKSRQATPNGAARVLRMHFNVTVTERAGLGISWDEESPPLYENVPASPPTYGQMEAFEGLPGLPDYENLSALGNLGIGESHELP